MNTLSKLILEHLDKAGTHMLPEGTLRVELREMTRPVSTDVDFNIAFQWLLKKGYAAHEEDELSEEKMWFITESGRVVRLRRNPKVARE